MPNPFPFGRRPVARALAFSLISLLAACGGSDDDDNAAQPETPPPVTPPVTQPEQPAGTQVAFMPDVHFHDVYATFKDGSFPGVPNQKTGRNATIRTMQAQMTSTRLFNENYFAFLAALDDAVARGVKFIALPGDFSDDGQPVHMRGFQKILDDYHARYGIEFFAAPGNHDPNRPLARAGGKSDYLGVDPATGRQGAQQAIYSRGGNGDCSSGYSGD